jgi:hypothetical protein
LLLLSFPACYCCGELLLLLTGTMLLLPTGLLLLLPTGLLLLLLLRHVAVAYRLAAAADRHRCCCCCCCCRYSPTSHPSLLLLLLLVLTGMMPILHSPGLMMPGQLGPMSRVLLCSLIIFFTFTCSSSTSSREATFRQAVGSTA